MNPAAIAGAIVAALAAARASQRESATPVAPESALVIVIWMVLGPLWLVESIMLLDALVKAEWLLAAQRFGLWAAMSIVLFPWPIARLWLIPRGHARLAGRLTRLSFWVWRRDVPGGSLVAASWALARAAQRGETLSAETIAWIEKRLTARSIHSHRWTLSSAGIVAAGLLAEARGDRAQARRLITSAGEQAAPTWPTAAMRFAWEWLCAEAMTRGAWREVELLARTAPVESRTLRFVGSVAARLTGVAPVPNDLVLQWQWFAAPNRVGTYALLRRAVAAPRKTIDTGGRNEKEKEDEDERPAPTLPDGPPMLAAMALHAHTLTREPKRITRSELGTLARAWDAALADPQLDRTIEERGEALGSHASARNSVALADAVRDDLLALIRAAGLELGSLGDDSEILGRASRQLHGELLDALEVTIGALEGRVEGKRELPPIDEWQAFLSLREQYAEAVAVGGLALRRLAFTSVHAPVCALAVWLWNNRGERAIGNAMFSWLLAEAIIVDDAEAIRLQERNVRCGV